MQNNPIAYLGNWTSSSVRSFSERYYETSHPTYIPFQEIVNIPKPEFLYKIEGFNYHLIKPLILEVEKIDNLVLISDPVFNLYGVGKNKEIAISDFTSMLIDLFEELSKSEKELSESLSQQLQSLCEYLSPN